MKMRCTRRALLLVLLQLLCAPSDVAMSVCDVATTAREAAIAAAVGGTAMTPESRA
jgi:hypothetical protein